jgi:hypothetical protein
MRNEALLAIGSWPEGGQVDSGEKRVQLITNGMFCISARLSRPAGRPFVSAGLQPLPLLLQGLKPRVLVGLFGTTEVVP